MQSTCRTSGTVLTAPAGQLAKTTTEVVLVSQGAR